VIKLTNLVLSKEHSENIASWEEALSPVLRGKENHVKDLRKYVIEERKKYDIYPSSRQTLRALTSLNFNDVKVVVLGQDPYHTKGMANGLSFSVGDSESNQIPPSLENIYKEIKADTGKDPHVWGEYHVSQGVLLLNTALTVRRGEPGSHAKAWHFLTSAILGSLLENNQPKVFLLWGKLAQISLGSGMDESSLLEKDRDHLFLKSAHPSPFSCKGFFGNKHFSKCNQFLVQRGLKPVTW
jgi:uracil-DNA glycosylase